MNDTKNIHFKQSKKGEIDQQVGFFCFLFLQVLQFPLLGGLSRIKL
jgi:hypothetical protein